MSTACSVRHRRAQHVSASPDFGKKRITVVSGVVIQESRENDQPDADLYEQLVKRERKLDRIIQRKRIELQDEL